MALRSSCFGAALHSQWLAQAAHFDGPQVSGVIKAWAVSTAGLWLSLWIAQLLGQSHLIFHLLGGSESTQSESIHIWLLPQIEAPFCGCPSTWGLHYRALDVWKLPYLETAYSRRHHPGVPQSAAQPASTTQRCIRLRQWWRFLLLWRPCFWFLHEPWSRLLVLRNNATTWYHRVSHGLHVRTACGCQHQSSKNNSAVQVQQTKC